MGDAFLEQRTSRELGIQVDRVAVAGHGREQLDVLFLYVFFEARLLADFQFGVGRVADGAHGQSSDAGAGRVNCCA